MTAAQILRSLPKDPARARLELDGALDPRWVDDLAPEERSALQTRRPDLMRRVK